MRDLLEWVSESPRHELSSEDLLLVRSGHCLRGLERVSAYEYSSKQLHKGRSFGKALAKIFAEILFL